MATSSCSGSGSPGPFESRTPSGPGGPAALAHHGRRRVRPFRLGSSFRGAVVADHRRGEAEELLRVARVGDELLVARHRGREHRLAERKARRADRVPPKDRLVLEGQESAHAEKATRPAATVSRIFERSVLPRSHEFADRERKPSSFTRQLAFGSKRTRFAGAPTSIRGGSIPYARAGPADMRSS